LDRRRKWRFSELARNAGEPPYALHFAVVGGVCIILCHPAQNFSGPFTGPVVKTRYFVTQSPTTGRTALKVDGPPFDVVCWTGVDETTGQPTGNSCPIIYLEQVQ
jgi:hypothetical protein